MRYTIWKLPVIAFITCLLVSCGDSNSSENTDLEIQSYLSLADVYRQQGQFRASIIEAQNALQLDEQNVETRLFIAQVFMDFGDYSSAVEILNVAQELDPENTEVKIYLAEAYFQARLFDDGYAIVSELSTDSPEMENQKNWLIGNFEAAFGNTENAASAFETVLEADPTHLKTLLSFARLKYLTGDEAGAIELTDRAIEADIRKDNVDLWIWRGQLATFQEDWPTAEEGFFEALDIMSLYDTMTAKRFSTLQNILVPLRNQNKNAEALRYSEIIGNSPQGQLLSSFSNALSLFQSGDMLEAENALNATLQLAPNHPGGNILLGLSKYQQGDFAEAERLLGEFVNVDSASAEMVTTLADTYLKNNNTEGALTILEQALQNEPENTSFLAMIGIIKQSLGDPEAALSNLNSALAISPDSPELIHTLGSIYAQQGDLDMAIATLTRAIQVDSEFETSKTALMQIYLSQNNTAALNALVADWLTQNPDSAFNNLTAGTLAAQNASYDEARNYFRKALESEPVNVTIMLNLARIEVLEENYDAAEAMYDQVLAIEPVNSNALSGLLAMGDLTETSAAKVAMVQQVISNFPEDPLPSVILGQYYLLSGNLDTAAEYANAAYRIEANTLTQNFMTEIYLQDAIRASENGDNVTAKELANQALEMNGNAPRALTIAANLEAQDGNFIRAQELVTRLKAIQPDQPAPLVLEGDIIISGNDASGAMVSYMDAWNLQPSNQLGLKIYQVFGILEDDQGLEDFLTAWSEALPEETTPRLLLAMELQAEGREQEALNYYEQIYITQKENVVVLNNMAWLYQDSDPARSLELASSAAGLYPENPDVLDTYGWILLQQDNRDQAIEVLEKAANLAPDSVEIQEHLNTARNN